MNLSPTRRRRRGAERSKTRIARAVAQHPGCCFESEETFDLAERSDSSHQALPLEDGEILRNRFRWALQAHAVSPRRGTNRLCVQGEEIDDEVVGMDGLDSVLCDRLLGEIVEIERDDCIGRRVDRRRQDVAIFRVGKNEVGNQELVPRNEAIPHVRIHEIACALELFSTKVRARCENTAHPLLVDSGAPPRVNEIGESEKHQEVAKRRWVKDAGVVDDCPSAQGS